MTKYKLLLLGISFTLRSSYFFKSKSKNNHAVHPMKLSSLSCLLIIAFQCPSITEAYVRGSVRPAVKNGGAINPHLANIDVSFRDEEKLRLVLAFVLFFVELSFWIAEVYLA